MFESQEEAQAAIDDGIVQEGHVVVIRYEGPKGGPGMPEMLAPTSAIIGRGLGTKVALNYGWTFLWCIPWNFDWSYFTGSCRRWTNCINSKMVI